MRSLSQTDYICLQPERQDLGGCFKALLQISDHKTRRALTPHPLKYEYLSHGHHFSKSKKNTNSSVSRVITDNIRVLSSNARILRNKIDELQCIAKTKCFDVIVINETFDTTKSTSVTCRFLGPSQEYDEIIQSFLQGILRNSDALILATNLPQKTLMGSEGESHRMFLFVEHNFLSQMVTVLTREDNIIDLVLVTQENLVDNVSVGKYLCSCDHRLMRLVMRAQTRIAEKKVLIPNFKRTDFERISQSFTNFELVSNIDTVEFWQDSKTR